MKSGVGEAQNIDYSRRFVSFPRWCKSFVVALLLFPVVDPWLKSVFYWFLTFVSSVEFVISVHIYPLFDSLFYLVSSVVILFDKIDANSSQKEGVVEKFLQ